MRYKIAATVAGVLLSLGTLAACGEEETKTCDEWTEYYVEQGTFTPEDATYADLGCAITEDVLPQYDTDNMTEEEYAAAFEDAAEWLDNQVPDHLGY